MTGISSSGAPNHQAVKVFQGQGADQQARIQFENALAAERSALAESTESQQAIPPAGAHANAAMPMPQTTAGYTATSGRRTVPVQQVLRSLNRLVQHRNATPSLDIRQ